MPQREGPPGSVRYGDIGAAQPAGQSRVYSLARLVLAVPWAAGASVPWRALRTAAAGEASRLWLR